MESIGMSVEGDSAVLVIQKTLPRYQLARVIPLLSAPALPHQGSFLEAETLTVYLHVTDGHFSRTKRDHLDEEARLIFNESIYDRTLVLSERLGEINTRNHSEYLSGERATPPTKGRYESSIPTSKELRFPPEYNDNFLVKKNWTTISGGSF